MTAKSALKAQQQIERNIQVHNRVARNYEMLHGEIFNDVEQRRLASALARARDAVLSGSTNLKALDFGCGSGNLSRHLLNLGVEVTAADVSVDFLRLVERRFVGEPLSLYLMNGRDLREVPDDTYDMIAAYSVLHHIPDYLGSIRELARVTKPGGVILLDHEQNEAFWNDDPTYKAFVKEASRFDWRKFLKPVNYVHKLRRLINPRYTNEGDIHVFADDHIEWPKIKSLLDSEGFEPVLEEDYLLYRALYRREVYDRYVGRCTDTKLMIFRKSGN